MFKLNVCKLNFTLIHKLFSLKFITKLEFILRISLANNKEALTNFRSKFGLPAVKCLKEIKEFETPNE